MSALGSHLRRSVQRAAQRLSQAVAPHMAVSLERSDGSRVVALARGPDVLSVDAGPNAVPEGNPGFAAIELPSTQYLTREMRLPPLDDQELLDAVGLEVASVSPFPADDLLWAYAGRTGADLSRHVDVVICSRKRVAEWLSDRQVGGSTEVWAIQGLGVPVILPWGGETLRQQKTERVGQWRLALAALAVALLAGVLVTPVLQLRLKAIAAGQAHERLAAESRPALDARAALLDDAALVNQIRKHGAAQAEPLKVLNTLSQFIPDTAWLQGVKLEGMTVSLTGMAANATDLFQRLERTPGVLAVKPTSPVTRGQGGALERFTVDVVLSPAVYGRLPDASGGAS